MANEIKLDGILNPATLTNAHNKTRVKPTHSIVSEDLKVSNHLGTHVSKLVAQNQMPDNHARIQALKHQVQSNQYRVDFEKLADKLAHTLAK